MPEVQLESKKFTEEVVMPGYKDILTRAWNRLLWEPTITYDPERPLKETPVEAPTRHHEWKGFHFVTIDAEAVMRGRLFKETEDPERFILTNAGPGYEVTLSEYVAKVSPAERVLNSLRDEQEEELRTSPEGKLLTWKPGQDLLGFTNTEAVGYGNQPVKIWVRQGKFYCPDHKEFSELRGDRHFTDSGRYGLTCPVNPDHFWVFIK